MLRRLLRDSAIYLASAALGQAIAFLLFPFLAHKLTPRTYAVVELASLLSAIALVTVALEINQGFALVMATEHDPAERRVYASTVLIWSVGCYSAFAVVALVLAHPLTAVVFGSGVRPAVTRVAVIGIWVAGALFVVQDQMRWQMRPRAFAAIAVTTAVASAGAIAVYVFALNAGALGVVAGQLTGSACGFVLALCLARKIFSLRFDRAKARRMLAFSIPLVPSSVGVFLNVYADRLAIQHQESLAAVGVYAVGIRVSLAVSLLLIGAQAAGTPIIVARHAEPETPAELARGFRVFWAAGLIVFLVLSLLSETLVAALSGPSFFASARIVPFLVMAAFLAGLYVFAPGPAIVGRTRTFAVANVTAGLINLALAFGLVPSFGIRGAAWATLTASAFLFIATMWISQGLYPVPHHWPRLAAGAGAAVAVVAVTRSLLVDGRHAALTAGPLLERLGVSLLGAGLLIAVLIDRDELLSFARRARARRA